MSWTFDGSYTKKTMTLVCDVTQLFLRAHNIGLYEKSAETAEETERKLLLTWQYLYSYSILLRHHHH